MPPGWFHPTTVHNIVNAPLCPILPVQCLANYQKKENATHAHFQTALCAWHENRALGEAHPLAITLCSRLALGKNVEPRLLVWMGFISKEKDTVSLDHIFMVNSGSSGGKKHKYGISDL